MTVEGFDPKWKDFPDYILGITHEIWEQRQVQSLHHYYAPDIIVRSPASVVVGNEGVIAATLATLAEFPDRVLLGEDVIWCGDADTGFLSSHRITTQATHSGSGVYGPASGKKLTYRVIADCAAKNNTIYDEWLVRDQGAVVRQLGWDPKHYAVNLIEREGGPEQCVQPLSPETDQPGPYQSQGNQNPSGQRYAELVTRIMNTEISAIGKHYDRACQLELPGGVTAHGRGAAESFWMSLRAAFPSAQFAVQHVIGREDQQLPARAALRWSLHGVHEGWGMFGEPSQAEVYILGLSHAEFGPRGLHREFILFDETAIWKQIVLKSG